MKNKSVLNNYCMNKSNIKTRNNKVYAFQRVRARVRSVLYSQKGEAYVDMAVKILIGVVIGALLLGGLYSLFGDSVLPQLTQKINSMFDYTAAGP